VRRLVWVSIPVSATSALLAASLASLASSPASAAEHVGAEACRTCHEPEYQQWRASGHAVALARLTPVQQRDRACRSCHTMAPLSDDASLSGVQCESCHGAGGLYDLRYVMKDRVLSRLLGLKEPTEEACATCHTQEGPSVRPFVWKEKIELVRHLKKKAEPASSQAAPTGPGAPPIAAVRR
jgi:hypothetical protein